MSNSITGVQAGQDGRSLIDGESSKRKKRHRRRVRSAWISFVGRIVAQFVGSAASIVLALILLGKYQPGGAVASTEAGANPVVPAAAVAERTPETRAAPIVLVLPLDGFSDGARREISSAIVSALERGATRPAASGGVSASRALRRGPAPAVGSGGTDLVLADGPAPGFDASR